MHSVRKRREGKKKGNTKEIKRKRERKCKGGVHEREHKEEDERDM